MSNRDAILFLVTFAGFVILMLVAVLLIGRWDRNHHPAGKTRQTLENEDDDE